MINELALLPSWIFPFIIIISIWEAIWKGIAMWKSARNNHLAWFVCILIFNTIGILPIVYLLFFQKNRNTNNLKLKKKKR